VRYLIRLNIILLSFFFTTIGTLQADCYRLIFIVNSPDQFNTVNDYIDNFFSNNLISKYRDLFASLTDENSIVIFNRGYGTGIDINSLDIIINSYNNPDLIIFFPAAVDCVRGFSFIRGTTGVIVCPIDSGVGVLLHEIGHVLFGLGDEYGGNHNIRYTSNEVGKYTNLSLSTFVEAWEQIKSETNDPLIGYYEGGLGTDTGVFRAYPDCIMRSSTGVFCPICEHIIINILEVKRLLRSNP